MKAAQVHAVLAGGVSDPRRLAAWAAAPQALQALGIDPHSLDLRALRGFAGLALKVRHNGLRDALPHSFRLMHVAGIEIELFADYALACAEQGIPLAATDAGRAHALIEFVRQWHDPGQGLHAMLWDLLRHEQALLELQRPEAAPTRSSVPPTPRAVLRVRGAVRLHEMQHDPAAIVQALRRRAPDLQAVAPAPHAWCYWQPPGAAGVRIVELDAFGFAAVQAAAQQCRVGELSQALGLGARVPAAVRGLLGQLQRAGLLDFERRR
jgi:hypothetical protein